MENEWDYDLTWLEFSLWKYLRRWESMGYSFINGLVIFRNEIMEYMEHERDYDLTLLDFAESMMFGFVPLEISTALGIYESYLFICRWVTLSKSKRGNPSVWCSYSWVIRRVQYDLVGGLKHQFYFSDDYWE